MRAALPAVLLLLIAAAPGVLAQDRSRSRVLPDPSTLFQPADSTADYVQRVGVVDIFLVESSKVMLAKGSDPQVKSVAQMILDEHGWMTAQLGQTAEELEPPVPVPVKLDRPYKKLLAELNRAPRADLDRLYVQMQVKAHEEALAQHTIYAVRGEQAELRTLADGAKPIVQAHLKTLRSLFPGS